MKLTELANLGADLSGMDLFLVVADPNGDVTELLVHPDSSSGFVTVLDLATALDVPGAGFDFEFDQEGTYSIQGQFRATRDGVSGFRWHHGTQSADV